MKFSITLNDDIIFIRSMYKNLEKKIKEIKNIKEANGII